MPAAARLGFSFEPFKEALILAGDIEIDRSNKTYGHLGLDLKVAKGLAMRAGFDRGVPTAGLSLDLLLFTLDYAALFTESTGTIQRFETGIKFSPDRAAA